MKNNYYQIYSLIFLFVFGFTFSKAAVTIGTGSATGLCVESTYTGIGDVTISENIASDISIGTNVTFNLNLPSGFEFNTSSGSVSSTGADITSISGAFTSNTNYRVTLTVVSTSSSDVITISGLQVRATSYGASGDITRFNGSAIISGFEEGTVAANLSSGQVPTINNNPSDKEICATSNTSFSVNASGISLAYQWQVDDGGGWINLAEALPYSNTTSATLNITAASTTLNGYQYRCIVTEIGECSINSTPATLTVNPLPDNSTTVSAVDAYLCYNTGTGITLSSSEVNVEYQLKNGSVNVGSPVSGTGGSINLPTGNLTATTTFTVEATNSTTGCSQMLIDDAVVNVNPALSVNATTDDNVLCSGSSTGLTATASGGSGAYTYEWNPTSGLDDHTIATPIFTAGTSNETFTVTLTDADANYTGCNVQDQVSITVNPLPDNSTTVSAVDAYLCYNTGTGITLSSSEVNVEYQLKNGSVNVGSPVSGTGGSINLPTGNLTATTTFTVEATNSTTGCSQMLIDDAVVNVNPALSVNASVGANVICGDENTTLTASAGGGSGAYTYSWSPTPGLNDPLIANPNFVPPSSGTYIFTVTATDASADFNSCTVTDEVTIIVNELPTVDAGLNTTICENTSIQIGNDASGGQIPYAYSWTPSASLNDASLAQPIASPLTNTNYTVTVTDANGCQNSDGISISVTPAPAANAGSDEEICQDVNFNFSSQSMPASVSNHSSYLWTTDGLGTIINDNTLTPTYQPAPGENGIIKFTLTVNGNGICTTPALDEMFLTINPTPDFDIINNQPVICDDNAVDIDLTSPDPNAIISLNAVNNASGNVTGHTPVGTSFLPGSKINSVLSNNTNDTLDIIYSFGVSALGCTNPNDTSIIVRVNPIPTFSVINNLAEFCSGSATDIQVNSPTEGGEIVLLDVNYGSGTGTLIDSQTFLPGDEINDPVVNNTTAPIDVTYRFNVVANGCTSNQSDQIITVKVFPEPNYTFTNNTPTICSGTTTDILLQSTYLPDNDLTFEIININSNGFITGNSPVGTTFSKGGILADNLLNTGNVSDTLKYEIQISYNGLCLGETDIIEVAVNPAPSVAASVSDPLICNNEITNITLSDPKGVAGTNFSWIAIPEAGVSGATSGTGNVINNTLINASTPYSVKEVLYQITAQSSNGCNSSTLETTIEVNPEIVVDAGPDQNLCKGGTITIGGSPTAQGGAGTYLYTWTGPSAADFVSSSTIANPSVEPNTLGLNTYSVQVEDANNCISNVDEVIIEISQEVAVNITTDDDFICSGDSASVLGAISGGATTGTWSTSGTGTFEYAANVLDNVYIPSTQDQTNGSVILTLTSADPSGPCTSNSEQVTIRISPAVIADAGDNIYICEGGFAQIGGDVPASGGSGFYTISWTGPDGYTSTASNPIVSPATIGSNEYTLSVVDDKGCKSDADIVTVFVNEKAIVDAGEDFAVCETTQVNLSGNVSGGSSGGEWVVVLGNGTISGNTSTAGEVTAIYNTTPADYGNLVVLDLIADDPDGTGPAGPCEIVSDRLVVTINSLPTPSILNLPFDIAINADPITVFGDPTGGTFSGNGIVSGTNNFDPALAGEGTHAITYTYVHPTTGCTNQVSQNIIVNPLPDVQIIGLASEYCYDDAASVISGNPTGGVFSGPGITFGSGNFLFQPSTAGVGLHNISYQYTDENNVTVVVEQEVRINSSPRPQFSIDQTQSCVTDDILFTDETTIPGAAVFSDEIATWNWNMNNGEAVYSEQNPSHNFNDFGNTPVSLEVTTLYGCTFSTFREIVVGAVPEVDFNFSNIAAGDFTQFTNATSLPESAATMDGIDSNSGYFWDFDFSGVTSTAQDTGVVFPGVGNYNVKLRATTVRGCVDSAIFLVEIIPLISTEFPYFEDFEDGRSGWTLGGSNSSWELANPNGSVINSASSGTNAWITNADGEYNALEQSHVNSPAFDLSQLERPMLSLKIWVHPEPQRDGAVLQYSVNGGKDWLKLGTIGDGLEWYDYRGIISNPGGQDFATEGYEGWTDPTNGWVEASYSLQSLASFDQVRFRIAFASDERNPIESDFNGFAFDDFEIKNRTRLVLIEHFTNTDANAAGDNHINAIEDALNPDAPAIPYSEEIPREVVSLRYHLNYPSSDPFFDDNTPDMSARREYYDYEVPLKSVVDGSNMYNPGGNTLDLETSMIVKNSLIDPKFKIIATVNETEINELSISTIIEALDTFYNKRIIVHLAVIERMVSLEGTQYRNVLKKLIPDAGGTEFLNDWAVGTTQSFNVNWNIDNNFVPIYDPNQLGLIIFVQDRISKEVYQTSYLKLPPKEGNPTSTGDELFLSLVHDMTLYPNPVVNNYFKVVFPQPLQKEFHYRIVDLRGIELMEGKLEQGKDEFEFKTHRLANGINLFMIGNEDGEYHIRKFLVE